jgi:hypothetical protein
MSRQIALVVALGLGVCVALVASAAGWLGPVVVCGADRAPGCVTWPTPVAGLVWAVFIGGVAALVLWQVRYLDR